MGARQWSNPATARAKSRVEGFQIPTFSPTPMKWTGRLNFFGDGDW